ncbi:1-(5-phosphoribosyl)-5-[(5-phosphoribosylamino)methylideneamino]imidazole-4-carboxamide isomerase [Patescibacteria group bacterium]|nr:1-(5-phosphoribosyl)-5-[(5-phosphoribosylamino)methylideneamino]imidazole-4-carboxamide isomerase [Patescibacteria group bacterium]
MEVIPAIDIISGKCVRLTRGDYQLKKIYNDTPIKTARRFERAGFRRLHLIDLEGAREGKIKNWKSIKNIAENTNLLLQVGGGIHSQGDIKTLFDLGVDRVILGTVAIKESQKLKKFLKKFGNEKIAVAVDIRKNKICYRGWRKEKKITLRTFLKSLIRLGIKTAIVTDIERDGMLRGPNFSLYKTLIKTFSNLEIIASGGIRTKEDLQKLSKIGLSGAVVGKAIYEKKILLKNLKAFL